MVKKIVFFNNKGGVGKTTLLYHLGYALQERGKKILFVDLDPQCNLTASICQDDEIEDFWQRKESVYHSIEPLIKGTGDVKVCRPYKDKDKNVWLLIGDILLSDFEETLSQGWIDVLGSRDRGFLVTSALFRLIEETASANKIDYAFIDVGPNLGSLNRAVLLSCDNYLIPLIPDLFSLRGLQNMGDTFKRWMDEWKEAVKRFKEKKEESLDFPIQDGTPVFTGYTGQQFNIYRRERTKAWSFWKDKIPLYIKKYIVDKVKGYDGELVRDLNSGSYHLGDFRNYHSLIPKSQEKRKPVFYLGPKDGVLGQHTKTVDECKVAFEELAEKLDENLN